MNKRELLIDFQKVLLAGVYKYELCRDNIEWLADSYLSQQEQNNPEWCEKDSKCSNHMENDIHFCKKFNISVRNNLLLCKYDNRE